MSITPNAKIFPITNRDLLIFRFAKSKNLSYLRCRDSRCKQNVYKIHDNHFKSKIGNHLSVCRFQQEQPEEKPIEITSTKTEEPYLNIKRKSSDTSYNCNNEHNSTSIESKQPKVHIKTEKVGVFEIKDEESSINNTSSLELDIDNDEYIDNNYKLQYVDFLPSHKINYDNSEVYAKMFSHFIGFMDSFFSYWNTKESQRKQKEDKKNNNNKVIPELGEVDINN